MGNSIDSTASFDERCKRAAEQRRALAMRRAAEQSKINLEIVAAAKLAIQEQKDRDAIFETLKLDSDDASQIAKLICAILDMHKTICLQQIKMTEMENDIKRRASNLNDNFKEQQQQIKTMQKQVDELQRSI